MLFLQGFYGFFFFSSRRRHTRSLRDWSSDVCSSDLVPDAFFITESFTILAMVIVGGMGTLIGPVCGAILLTVLPEPLRGLGDLRLIVYGLALTLVVLFMPGGIAQAVQLAAARLRRLGLRSMPAEHRR